MKRLFVQLIIITTIFTTCLTCPVFGTRFALPVYAASGDITSGIAKANMVDAFKAYCKSRDMTIDGSVLDAVDNFTSQTFEDICDTLGIDMTALQAQIQKVVDPNSSTIKYFIFTSFGINGFNRIFAQLLQDNDLAVGDENVDKTIKSGRWFTDNQGRGAWVYLVRDDFVLGSYKSSRSQIYDVVGTAYRFNQQYFANMFKNNTSPSETYTINGKQYYFTWPPFSNSESSYIYMRSDPNSATVMSARYSAFRTYGSLGIFLYKGKYYLGVDRDLRADNQFAFEIILEITDPDADDTDVKIVSPTIKPALPETPTSIAPDGKTSPSDKDPTADPVGGTPPDWNTDTEITPDGDGWNIPFTLPDLNIDWSIQGLTNKFPFCIPFDLVNLIQVLDVDPRAPQIQGTVNLMVYQWEVDMDFERFDEVAEIFRNLVYIGFVLGLILITRKLIKG